SRRIDRPLRVLRCATGTAAAAAFSSRIVFHAPQDSHLLCLGGDTAPQAWQTKEARGLAMLVHEFESQKCSTTALAAAVGLARTKNQELWPTTACSRICRWNIKQVRSTK